MITYYIKRRMSSRKICIPCKLPIITPKYFFSGIFKNIYIFPKNTATQEAVHFHFVRIKETTLLQEQRVKPAAQIKC